MLKRCLFSLMVVSALFFTACSVELEEYPSTSSPLEGISSTPRSRGETSDQSTSDITPPAGHDSDDERYFEESGLVAFSYIPPEGWMAMPDKQTGLTGWLGPLQSGGSRCQMGFFATESTATSKEAAQEAMNRMSGAEEEDVEMLADEGFSTQSDLDAYRVILRAETEEADVVFGMYLFSEDGYVISTFYFRLADDNPEQDAIIERSMETMRFE